MIFIGSMNLDPRSASTNTEFGMFIDSPALAKELLRVINISKLERRLPGAPRSRRPRSLAVADDRRRQGGRPRRRARVELLAARAQHAARLVRSGAAPLKARAPGRERGIGRAAQSSRCSAGRRTMIERMGEFDYVIVGGGSAGCVLAARLSEDPFVRVCLLEAGPADKSVLIHCPAGLRAAGQERRRQLGLRDRAAAGPERPPRLPAARQGARRLELGQRHDLRARPAATTTTTGPPKATPAGAGPTCCPTSSAPSTTSAAPTPATAAAARST